MIRLGLVGVVVLAACGSDPKVTPCNADPDCNLAAEGQCVASSAGFDQCAYPLESCSSGYAFGDLSGSLAGTCVPAVFDVAYASEWRFSISGPVVDGFAQIVNTGPDPLDLSALSVVSVTDDHAMAVVGVSAVALTTRLAPGTAGGDAGEIVAALVPESRVDPAVRYFTLEVTGLPAGPLQSTFDINARVTIAVGAAQVVLPVTLHMVSGLDPVVYADPQNGARKSAFL